MLQGTTPNELLSFMTFIDNFIHNLIRRRFNLPADTPVGFAIVPNDDGIFNTPAYTVDAYQWVDWIYGKTKAVMLKDYDSWDEFVADMERDGND